jgi:hypothetical protein
MWWDAEGRQRSKTFPGDTPRSVLADYHRNRLEETRQRRRENRGAQPGDEMSQLLALLRIVGDGIRATLNALEELNKAQDAVLKTERMLLRMSRRNVANE